jgi:DegV family protein with EDD domain
LSKIGIVTDSTAYLDEDYARENDIKVVPLKVIFGKEAYREGVDITSEEFFKKLKESPELPTTSSPSLGEFLEAYEEMADKYDDIISLHIASGISGTVETARTAAYQLKSLSIEVVDSRFVSLAIGILIDQLMKGIKAGRSLSDLLGDLRRMIDNLKIYFIVDTLEYLHKGGRIGGAQAFLGTILKVKPILTLNGTIDAKEKVRGTGKAIARVLEIAMADLKGRKTLLGVSHVHNLEGGMHLREKVAEAFGCEQDDIFFNETGPVIGTHTGPGLLAFGYLPKEVLA